MTVEVKSKRLTMGPPYRGPNERIGSSKNGHQLPSPLPFQIPLPGDLFSPLSPSSTIRSFDDKTAKILLRLLQYFSCEIFVGPPQRWIAYGA